MLEAIDDVLNSRVEEAEKPQPVFRAIFKFVFGILSIILCIITWILVLLWLSRDDLGGFGSRPDSGGSAQYFNFHPLFMTTAFVLLLVPGIISFELYPFTRTKNKHIHSILMTLSVLCAIVGFWIIIDSHCILTDKGIYNTTHAAMGWLTLALFFVNVKYLNIHTFFYYYYYYYLFIFLRNTYSKRKKTKQQKTKQNKRNV